MMRFKAFLGLLAILSLFGCSDASEGHLRANKRHCGYLDRLADAVRLAEGNPNYGLVNDKWCVAEGACRYYAKEVLKVHIGRCGGASDLIACVGSYYAPVGADNDPRGLNSNWVRNVRYFMERGA